MPTYKHKVGNLGGTYSVDADLDNVQLSVNKIPEISTKVTALPRIDFGDINTNIRVKEIPKIQLEADTQSKVDVSLDANTRSNVNVALTEIPDVRAHVPAHYNLGISLFGVEIVSFSLCGETQVITEKYTPKRMEICK